RVRGAARFSVPEGEGGEAGSAERGPAALAQLLFRATRLMRSARIASRQSKYIIAAASIGSGSSSTAPRWISTRAEASIAAANSSLSFMAHPFRFACGDYKDCGDAKQGVTLCRMRCGP